MRHAHEIYDDTDDESEARASLAVDVCYPSSLAQI